MKQAVIKVTWRYSARHLSIAQVGRLSAAAPQLIKRFDINTKGIKGDKTGRAWNHIFVGAC